MSASTLSIQVTAPPGKKQSAGYVVADIISSTTPVGGVRVMKRPVYNQTITHFLGPETKIYKWQLRDTSTTLALQQAEGKKWAGLQGCICTVTETKNSAAESQFQRTNQTITNMQVSSVTLGGIVSTEGDHSQLIDITFEKLTPVGVPS